MTPATRLTLWRPSWPSLLGVGLLVVFAMSWAALPAPVEVSHGAPEGSAAGPDAGAAAGPNAPETRRGSDFEPDDYRTGRPPISCAQGPAGIDPAIVVHHGPRNAKVVALTFDDGWGGKNLERIVHLLQEKRVNATFFPVGQAIRHETEAWRKVAAAGFPIADHTFDHGILAGLCYADQLAELRRARAAVTRLLGVTPLPVMRPPGGLFDRATRAAATAAGEPAIVLWDVDTRDWTGIGAAQISASALAGRHGSIVVMHTSSPSTLRALPGIIRGFRKRGFELVTIGQLLGIDGAVPYPAGMGR